MGLQAVRLLRALLVALLCLAPTASQPFWQSRGSGYNVSVGGGGATPTTLNPSDKSAQITLSGGNLVMTGSAIASTDNVRTVASYSTGKFYCEMLSGAVATSYAHAIGLANSTASLTAGPGSPDVNSIALYDGDTNVYAAGGSAGNSGINYVGAASDVVGMAVDIGAGLIWFRVNGGNWNNSALNDPVTGVGGINVAAVSKPWFVLGQSGANAVNTFNFGTTAYANAAPVGYGNF